MGQIQDSHTRGVRDQNQLEVFRGDTNCSLSRELAQSMSGSCTQQQIVGTGSSPMGNCCPRVGVISTSISLAGELMPEFCAAFPSSARLLCIPHFHQRPNNYAALPSTAWRICRIYVNFMTVIPHFHNCLTVMLGQFLSSAWLICRIPMNCLTIMPHFHNGLAIMPGQFLSSAWLICRIPINCLTIMPHVHNGLAIMPHFHQLSG